MKRVKKILWKYAKPISYVVVTGISILLWSKLLDYILSQIK